ncbi:MAG: Hint domain-containing protein [Roseomonas sp.]|nr:Hint domain-containing protein [Roseomonas sp.]
MSGVTRDLTSGNDSWPGTGFPGQANTGNDSINGLADSDTINGGIGDDTLDGGDGRLDVIIGGLGNDSLMGGNGDFDQFSYHDATGGVFINLTTSRTFGAAGDDSFSGFEEVFGSDFADTMIGDGALGNESSYFFTGGDGNDVIVFTGNGFQLNAFGNDGDDSLRAGSGDQQILLGGAGADTLVLGSGFGQGADGGLDSEVGGVYFSAADSLVGGTGEEQQLWGDGGNDTLVAGGGNYQKLMGGQDDDSLFGSANGESLFGEFNPEWGPDFGTGNDTLNGGGGDDSLYGGSGVNLASYANASGAVVVNLAATPDSGTSSGADGNDLLIGIQNVLGGIGDDSIIADGADNKLDGGTGNDTVAGGAGADTLIGGAGNDFASYATASDTVRATLGEGTNFGVAEGGDGGDRLSSIEGLIGSSFNDTLVGNSLTNTLMGGEGSDSLFGGGGNDLLDFGAGNDRFEWIENVTTGNLTLIGGDGTDSLDLGAGWVSGPITDNSWINFERTIAGTGGPETVTMFTQGWENVVCFAEGTRIITPNGEDLVENLRAGDMVLAMRNGQAGFEALRWVGFMDIAVPRNAVMAAKTAPILIKAGAIGPGMPARDLRVSPDHAMEIDGHLIPAKHLLNGESIVQEVWCKRVRYFHLELEAHGLLLSEGTWSESYLDDGNRHAFNNAALTGLFLDFEAGRSKGQYDDQACLPVLRQGLKLDEIHGRLALRAEELARGAKGRRRG